MKKRDVVCADEKKNPKKLEIDRFSRSHEGGV